MRPKLVLVAGNADKAEIRLKLPTIVGRTREAGLMIAHKTVSRRHCELFERHGMLFVRDTGSRNGTLVDDAPIKESMVKPGHTLTIGPLTFRADYEPADAFISSDDPAEEGSAPGAMASTVDRVVSIDDEKPATETKLAEPKLADTPVGGELDFEDFGSMGEDDLDLDSMGGEEDKPAAAAASATADEAFALDDDLAIDFDLDDAAPAGDAASDDVVTLAMTDEPIENALPANEILSFESVDAPQDAKGGGAADISLDDDGDLGFDLDFSDAPAPAAAAAEEEADELGFTLEDLEDSGPALPAAAEAPAEEDDDVLSFELAEPEPEPAPEPKAAPAKAAPPKPAPKKPEASAHVKLGEEKPAGDDAGVSSFMKELGL